MAEEASAQCGDLIAKTVNASLQCSIVRSSSACESDGYVQYAEIIYCFFPEQLRLLGVAAFAFMMLWFFLALSVAAELFLCPALAVISQHLRLSHNVAGVTFLAFGNGAPDVFSSIAAVTSGLGDPGLSLGALLGAAVFLSSVIVGLVALMKPFTVMQRPLLRDLIFFIGIIYWIFRILYRGRVTVYDSVGFLLVYVFYVITVLVGRALRLKFLTWKGFQSKRLKNDSSSNPSITLNNNNAANSNIEANTQRQSNTLSASDELFFSTNSSLQALDEATDWAYAKYMVRRHSTLNDDESILVGVNVHRAEDGKDIIPIYQRPWLLQLWIELRPFSVFVWSSLFWYQRLVVLIKAPVTLLFTLSIPRAKEDDEIAEGRSWCKPLILLQCFICPFAVLALTRHMLYDLGGVMPAWSVAIVVAVVCAMVIHWTSHADRPPVYYKLFAYLGFAMAVIWIYLVAKEIVNMVQMFGVVFDISNEILGLTIIAWSNSLGDLVSDLTVANLGRPRMAISACFGGPLFNILLGVGIPFTYVTLKSGDYPVRFDPVLQVICLALLLSLCFSLSVLVFSGFRATRPYAVLLLIIYVTFLVVALLTEFGILQPILIVPSILIPQ